MHVQTNKQKLTKVNQIKIKQNKTKHKKNRIMGLHTEMLKVGNIVWQLRFIMPKIA